MRLNHSTIRTVVAFVLSVAYARSHSALADDSSAVTGSSMGATRSAYAIPEEGYRAYAGIGGGFGALLGNRYDSAPTGESFVAGLNFGRRTRRWEWDTGLGWTYSRRAGADSQGGPMSIRIRSGRADLSVRYRLLGGWQIGPVVSTSFGTDTRNTPTIGSSVATVYGGGKAVYDLPRVGPVALQTWGEVLTELSSPGRDPLTALVGVRVGLPVSFERKTDVIVVSNAAPDRDVRITLDTSRVYFGTSSSRLNPAAEATLRQAAEFLARSPSAWESVEVLGHADNRGPLPYNMELSRRRANRVRDILLMTGADETRVRAEAFGPLRPADPAPGRRAWARNRRVELVFRNVNFPDALRTLLSQTPTEKR